MTDQDLIAKMKDLESALEKKIQKSAENQEICELLEWILTDLNTAILMMEKYNV